MNNKQKVSRDDKRKMELHEWYLRGVKDGREELAQHLRKLLNVPSADDVAYAESDA